MLLDKSLATIKLKQYAVANAAQLTDPSILPLVQNYKRQIASRFLPLARKDIAKRIPDANWYISRKLDGEFTTMVYRDGELILVNPGATVRVGLPWESEAIEMLNKAGVKDIMVAGELYVTNDEGRRPRVHDTVTVARQPHNEENLNRLRYAAFDILYLDGQPIDWPYEKKWELINKIFTGVENLHPVETIIESGHGAVADLFDKWVDEEKSEGLVVRSETAGSFKLKPLHTIDAVVIGFTESSDDRAGMMHDLLLAVARADGSLQVLCRVGGGFSEELRRQMLSDLLDMVVKSEYAEVNSDHVAYQMVEPKWVVEISCLDVISQNTRGGSIDRMILQYDSKKKEYTTVRRFPLVSVISPQFVRIREDKTAVADDIRIAQVTDIVPVEKSEVVATEYKLPESELLKREVFVKTLKGNLLVRKFLMWKTNKAHEASQFPAFVVHYTDFSPTRKTPLDREVRVSNSEEQIERLYDGLKEEYIKKGWKPAANHATEAEFKPFP